MQIEISPKLAYSRQHRKNNIDKYRKSAREWRDRNKEEVNRIKKERRWAIIGEPKPPQTEAERKAYRKAWYMKNKDSAALKSRQNELRRTFGITVEQYNEIFNKQNGRCAICDRHQSEFKNSLAVDHCHETNKVRGLLCFHCNTSLGHFRDNPALLKKAIEYINESNRT
jgi:hypothetical protein